MYGCQCYGGVGILLCHARVTVCGWLRLCWLVGWLGGVGVGNKAGWRQAVIFGFEVYGSVSIDWT